MIIACLDAHDPAGWIVDLRDNRGGNMWPMLAGLGPLLGEGEASAFIPLHGTAMRWAYRNGAAGIDGHPVATVSGRPYPLRRPAPRVAVLTGPRTVSSGEAVAAAFRSCPLTRSFGEPTRGLSTGNGSFRLSDGATIFLATSVYADRTGRTYGEAIQPDELIDHTTAMKPEHGDRDIDAAVAWLKSAQGADANK